jgi:hypothetical protein
MKVNVDFAGHEQGTRAHRLAKGTTPRRYEEKTRKRPPETAEIPRRPTTIESARAHEVRYQAVMGVAVIAALAWVLASF